MSTDDNSPYLGKWREELQKQIDVIDAIHGLIDTWTARVAKMPTAPPIAGKPVEIGSMRIVLRDFSNSSFTTRKCRRLSSI